MAIKEEIPLRQVCGRAHGDCSRCEIYHKVQEGRQSEQDLDDCTKCFLAGRTRDFPKVVLYLEGCVADQKKVTLPDGRVVGAEEALKEAYANPGFRVATTLNLD